MNIVLINTSDIRGGAAKAAYRLHEGLRQIAENSSMVVKEKSSQDDAVLQVGSYPSPVESPDSYYFSLIQQQYINAHRTDISNTIFSFPYPGHDLSHLQVVQDADIINLHWVAYFQSPTTLVRLFSPGKPVVWTLHDQWPFSGGCHYAAGCEKYRTDCSPCPQLAEDPFDLPAAILNDKLEVFRNANLTIVSPSKWLASCAKESALFRHFRVEVIPNSLDTDVFCPVPKPEAKAALGIPPDSITLLFGAESGSEKRKGFHKLMAAMRHCLAQDDFRKLAAERRITLLCFGHPSEEINTLGLPVVSLGYLDRDEDIRTTYSAADIFVLPSLEDNLPNTLLEAMSCGTPVIGFDTGGIPDVVENGVTGMVVSRGSENLLGEAILRILGNSELLATMAENARGKAVKDFGLSVQATRYLSLYSELCQKRPASRADKDAVDKRTLLPCADRTVGTHFGDIYDRVLFKSLKETVPALRTELQASEADRAARLEAIHLYQQQLQDSQHQLEMIRGQIDEVQHQLQVSEADRAARLEVIHNLDRQVRFLSDQDTIVTSAIVTFLRKFGLYNFYFRHQTFWGRIYRMLRRCFVTTRDTSVKSSPSTDVGVPAEGVQSAINSPLVEAFVAARSMEGSMDERALLDFYRYGSKLRHVVCIQPSARSVQAIYMLSQAGTKVTCIDCQKVYGEFQSPGIVFVKANLAEWMVEKGQTTLTDIDGLILDCGVERENLLLLKGRLWPETRIFVTGPTSNHHLFRSLWGDPHHFRHEGIVYETPPQDWVDPAWKDRQYYYQPEWPRKARRIDISSKLPSGRPWPRISIITVTLNQGAYLEETLRSVLYQGYPNLEYIVIDGGSTDNTLALLERYKNELTHCISEKDKGQSDALNKGFRLATGDILAWLNSDDCYPPGILWRVAMAFDAYGSDMVAGGCALFQEDVKNIFRTHHNAMPLGKVVPLPLDRLLDVDGSWQKGDFFYQPEVFWTRTIWERSGGRLAENLFYSMDYELWLRMAENGASIVHVPDVLALFRFHETQKTSGNDLPFLPELHRVNAEFQRKLKNR
ncbi:MAG: glycosyltransferase [Thermodesulfobacteriota bacterium]